VDHPVDRPGQRLIVGRDPLLICGRDQAFGSFWTTDRMYACCAASAACACTIACSCILSPRAMR
jgi:hypothetical protein